MLANGLPTHENRPVLLLRGVRKSFADVVAVDGLDLEVTRGECFGLLGPNGAARQQPSRSAKGLTAPGCRDSRTAGAELGHRRKLNCASASASRAGDAVS